MKRLINSLQVMVLLIHLVACNRATSTVISTPTIPSTLTNIPTATKTSTPFPTNTPLPTATPFCPPHPDSQTTINSVQEKTAALVPGARVTWYDDFICEDLSYGWGPGGFANPTAKVSVSNGVMTFSAQKVEGVWDAIGRPDSMGDQKGFLLLFRYQDDTNVNIFFCTGTWWTPDYKRWGVTFTDASDRSWWNGWQGSQNLNYSQRKLQIPRKVLEPNKWYYLLEKLGNNGQVTMKIWEKDDPSNHADFQTEMPSSWTGHQWVVLIQIYEGTVEIDEYQELTFDTPQ